MSTSLSPPTRSPFGRKIRMLAIAVVALAVLVIGGWFVGAQFYRAAIEQGRATLAAEGVRMECAEEALAGFPARFEWHCSSLALAFGNGSTLSGGSLSTVAPVWNPLFTIAEWRGPFRSVSAEGFNTQIDTELARASIRLTSGLELERFSAVLNRFSVTFEDGAQPVANGNQAELHVRSAQAMIDASSDDYEVALLAFGVTSPFLGSVDQVDLSLSSLLDAVAGNQARSVQGLARDWISRSGAFGPLAGRLRLDNHAINLDGSGRFAPDGLLDFRGTVATNDIASLVELFGIDASNGAAAITAGATFFGRQTTIGEDSAIELPVSVARGTISIGPVPLGVVPPWRP